MASPCGGVRNTWRPTAFGDLILVTLNECKIPFIVYVYCLVSSMSIILFYLPNTSDAFIIFDEDVYFLR